MAIVRVIALKDFVFAGRAVYAGQAVDMLAVEAAIRGRHGDVSLDPQMRATYQTRDMVAEPVQSVHQIDVFTGSASLDHEPEAATVPPTRRRGRPRKSLSV